MAKYQTYLLNVRDQVDALIEADFDCDRDAVRATSTLRPGHAAAEVWRDGCLVRRMGKPFAPFGKPQHTASPITG